MRNVTTTMSGQAAVVAAQAWADSAADRASVSLGADCSRRSDELTALRTTVDDLDYGVVVLDSGRRAQFINRAFRRFWRISDELAESRPLFVKLMYHHRGSEVYAVSHERLGNDVAKQLALIRSADHQPFNIHLRDGKILQFRCKKLPDGGRLLTYSDVSELVHEAEAIGRVACLDGLTGLNNRRHFMALAEIEWSRFKRYGRSLALLMADIDLFKSINDTYGHDVGDRVIKAVADVLNCNKRISDIVGRLGGEEFALMLPEATIDKAAAAAERFRQLVADCLVTAAERRVPVTISVGASSCEAGASTLDELLKQADVALYEAKRSGRNCIRRFQADTPAQDASVNH
jgi:diguanylate cyclase (GGDEF)-like protein